MPIPSVEASRHRLKRSIRGLTDRVMAPYVAEIIAGTSNAPAGSGDGDSAGSESVGGFRIPSDTCHNANHSLRTVELERVPKGAKQVLSVGANGRWYFDWFEASVGVVDRHVGVEAFEPKPDDLPPYVDWVVNTADHMDDVGAGTIDLVFAGQTTEHLWAHELPASSSRLIECSGHPASWCWTAPTA